MVDKAITSVKRKIGIIDSIIKQFEELKGKLKHLEENYAIQFPLDYLTFVEELSNGYLNEDPIQTIGGTKTYQSFVRRLISLLDEEKMEVKSSEVTRNIF